MSVDPEFLEEAEVASIEEETNFLSELCEGVKFLLFGFKDAFESSSFNFGDFGELSFLYTFEPSFSLEIELERCFTSSTSGLDHKCEVIPLSFGNFGFKEGASLGIPLFYLS